MPAIIIVGLVSSAPSNGYEERLQVSWSLTSLFSTNMAISETKGQEWKVIRAQ